jgi:hypothetical protein
MVDRGFEPRSVQTKNSKNGICCFSGKYATLRRKIKCWLARNQDNVSEWGIMSICGLLFQRASTITIQLSVLVYCKAHSSSTHWKWTCSHHDIAFVIALSNKHSLTQRIIYTTSYRFREAHLYLLGIRDKYGRLREILSYIIVDQIQIPQLEIILLHILDYSPELTMMLVKR